MHKKNRNILKKETAITLVSLIITVIAMLILAGVAIHLTIGDNGIFKKSEQSAKIHNKEEATEKMNMKITSSQMHTYIQEQRMPTLQELADALCEDEEMEYVVLESKAVASLEKIVVGDKKSIYTKIKKYPYEFEINSSLQLASVDGVKIADSNSTQIEELQSKIKELEEQNKQLNVRIEELNNASKKVKMKYLGTYNSTYSNTINVSSYEGYRNFTIDNFVITNVSFSSIQGETSSKRFESMLSNSSYNPNTGILTLERIVDPSYGWTRTINVVVYLILGEIEKE